MVADKTGSLIATSGRFGALMSGATDETVEVMTEFGELIGVAFQLADDVLDVSSEQTSQARLQAPIFEKVFGRFQFCTR